MKDIVALFKSKIPGYSEYYRDSLFNVIANYGGGDETSRTIKGRTFATGYELYTFAFFLGYYSGEKEELDSQSKKVNFKMPIHDWGRKTTIGRSSFVEVQDAIFIACMNELDIDLLDLDRNQGEAEKVVKECIKILEEFTNWGLAKINEEIENKPLLADSFFFDLMAAAQNTFGDKALTQSEN